MPPFLLLGLLTSGVAAVIDWRRGEIPNWLTVGALAVAVTAHFVAGAAHGSLTIGAEEAGSALAGALACGVVPFAFWTKGAFGGGDVKMLAALGAILQPAHGIEAELYALVAGALFAPVRLAWEGKLMQVVGRTMAVMFNPFLPRAKRRPLDPEMLTAVRFGPAIFAGVALPALLRWRSS
jgi:prepilin peptidase CpaA